VPPFVPTSAHVNSTAAGLSPSSEPPVRRRYRPFENALMLFLNLSTASRTPSIPRSSSCRQLYAWPEKVFVSCTAVSILSSREQTIMSKLLASALALLQDHCTYLLMSSLDAKSCSLVGLEITNFGLGRFKSCPGRVSERNSFIQSSHSMRFGKSGSMTGFLMVDFG